MSLNRADPGGDISLMTRPAWLLLTGRFLILTLIGAGLVGIVLVLIGLSAP